MNKIWYSKSKEPGQGLIIHEETGKNIAVSYDKANAPLLAAAPELFVALKDVEECLFELYKENPVVAGQFFGGALHRRMMDALSKAKGE